jgi:sec-independent protein translocase protein TatB
MNFLGIGGLELLIIGAIAVFVVGPARLAEGVRTFRKVMTELRRQRDDLKALVRDAIEYEEMKKQLDTDGLSREIEGLRDEMRIDQDDLDIGRPLAGAVQRPRGSRPSLPHRPPAPSPQPADESRNASTDAPAPEAGR